MKKLTKNIGMLLLAIWADCLGSGCACPGSRRPGPGTGGARHRRWSFLSY
jgi:hypothetical protein